MEGIQEDEVLLKMLTQSLDLTHIVKKSTVRSTLSSSCTDPRPADDEDDEDDGCVLVLQFVSSGVFLISKAELYHQVKRFKPSHIRVDQYLPCFTVLLSAGLKYECNLT